MTTRLNVRPQARSGKAAAQSLPANRWQPVGLYRPPAALDPFKIQKCV